jgi:hypothetical protein
MLAARLANMRALVRCAAGAIVAAALHAGSARQEGLTLEAALARAREGSPQLRAASIGGRLTSTWLNLFVVPLWYDRR